MRSRINNLILAAAWLLAVSCGGSYTAGIGSGGTGGSKAVSTGAIGGFGSIIVNGVKFDDTAAMVTIDGVPNRPVSDLRLGMVVEIRGEIGTNGAGRADSVNAAVAAQGPVTSVDGAAGVVQLLGQRVLADGRTVFDGLASLGALAPGDVIAVSGLRDAATGTLVATRIERRPPLTVSPTTIQVQGTIAALTSTTFRLDGLTVGYSGAQLLGAPMGGLANGLGVTVSGPEPPAGNTLAATSVQVLTTSVSQGATVEYSGFVSSFISPSNFRVGSIAVNAMNATFVGGTLASLANGARVEVEGSAGADGIVVASQVEFFASTAPASADVEGTISDFIAISNFVVRGQRVDASGAAFTAGAAADVANGRLVHVEGTIQGSVLVATSVEFKDTMPPEAQRLAVDGLITNFMTPASFRVNGQPVSTSARTEFSGGTSGDLANGRRVAAEGVVNGGVLMAATVRIFPPDVVTTVTTQGLIASFTGPGSFSVNGQAVAASVSTTYVSGSAASLANGVAVKVTGTITAGVLRAATIEFSGGGGDSQAEVEGYITDFVSPARFKVKGQVVDASSATYRGGTAANLANGLAVHATGKIANGVLKASLLEIDD